MMMKSVLLLAMVMVIAVAWAGKTKFTGFRYTQSISDLKEWKKLMKTRTNVLSLFAEGQKHVNEFLATFEKVAELMRGKGTLLFVDCAGEGKKLCKKLKMKPDPYELKHYKAGAFHKDYDRLMEVRSMVSFMENPSAEPPWYEDPDAGNVKHLLSPQGLNDFLQTEKKPCLVMFYAPWCGYCKKMKPELAAAATEVKGNAIVAGMDVDNPDSFQIRERYNITGFPTIIYFENGQMKYNYGGGRDKDGILKWLKDPKAPETTPTEDADEAWSVEDSEVIHLTTDMFEEFMSTHSSVLIMFYAPWCGHCKAMKPAYTEAAQLMKEQEVGGVLAAVDATKETELGTKFGVKGYPTIKYFNEGVMRYDYGYERTAEGIADFMMSPQEPPPPEKEWSEEESAVVHLTDETFKAHLKKKKHSLVMFYAPWCGHCKAAKPEFTQAAHLYDGDKKSSFAAVDCTKFQSICDQHDVSGFPTFTYFKYGKNSAPYQGGRTSDGFAEFMANPSAYLHNEL